MPIAEITTLFLCVLAVLLIGHSAVVVGLWKLFVKAGRPGWAAVIPLYRDIVRNQIAGMSAIWTYVGWIIYALILACVYVTDMVVEVFFLGWLLLCVCHSFTYGPFLKAYGRNSNALHIIAAVLFPYVVFPAIGFSTATYVDAGAPVPVESPATDPKHHTTSYRTTELPPDAKPHEPHP